MKKLLALIIAAILSMALFAGCGKKDNNTASSSQPQNSSGMGSASDNSAAAGLAADIDAMYKKYEPTIRVGNIPVDLNDADAVKSYTGLDSSDKISEIAVSESMIGSQAYSLVLLKVKDKSDTNTVANDMLNGINPAKWVCVNADDLKVVAKDDIIMLFMFQSDLEISSDDMVDAFKDVIGSPLDLELSK